MQIDADFINRKVKGWFIRGKMSITNIPGKVRCLLWGKAAGRCEFNGCNEIIFRDWLTNEELNFAQVAHIIGDSPNGPRGDVVLSEAYCSDIDNLMLMCPEHHLMIDEITTKYSWELLRQMKAAHELRVEVQTSVKEDMRSNVVIYIANIGKIQPKIDIDSCFMSLFPNKYPSSRLPIRLGINNSEFKDNEKDFWKIESENLVRQFSDQIHPISKSGDTSHFSVFSLAPQPLVIKLGSLFSDINNCDVYQLHREPPNWIWQTEPTYTDYIIEAPKDRFKNIALSIELSADIDESRINKVFKDRDFSLWKLKIENPNNDFLKSRNQLVDFRENFRSLLNTIHASHGDENILNIFPAVPVSIAFEMGRVRQPKADLPFAIYDQNRDSGGFTFALEII